MTEIMTIAIGVAFVGACWYAYRWGRDDGRAEGFEEGLAKGRAEGGDNPVTPSAVGGPGAVPR